jgi:hypothetical protein
MSGRQIVALVAAALLFFGVFAPIVSMPMLGTLNYFQNGKGDGMIVLALAGVSAVLALVGAFRFLWLTALACTGLLAFTFMAFHSRLEELKSQMDAQLAGNPFRGLADAAVQGVQMQWGWGVLVMGTLLLFAAAAMRDQAAKSAACPHCGGVVPLNQPSCNHCGNAVTWINGKARKPSRAAA